jgi:hypothetical protein
MEQHPLDLYGPLPIPGTPLAHAGPIRGILIGLPVSLLAWFGLIFGANSFLEWASTDTPQVVEAWAGESTLIAQGAARRTRLADRHARLCFGQSVLPAE